MNESVNQVVIFSAFEITDLQDYSVNCTLLCQITATYYIQYEMTGDCKLIELIDSRQLVLYSTH